jgi:hypothetical protein
VNWAFVAVGVAGLALLARKKEDPIMPDEVVKPGQGEPQLALIAGDPKDPEIAALLIEFDDYLKSYGAGKYTCAEEFFGMPEAPRIDGRRPVAIAPRNLWPNAIPTLRAFDQLRAQWGRPIPIRGYRPRDYNAAVGGAPRSIHQWAGAIDMKVKQQGYNASERQDFAILAARYTLDNPGLQWGFGVYNDPPTTVHLDTGYQRRSWENGRKYLDIAKQGNA